MSKGLTFSKDVKVKVGDIELGSTEFTLEYDVDGKANKFTVSIPVKDNHYTVGAEIEVTYTATLNEKAVAQISTNQATLTYSNNPINSSEKGTIKLPETKVYSSTIVIDKYKEGETGTKLPGAEFVLYKVNPTDSSKKYFKCDPMTKNVTWEDTLTAATTVTTNDRGVASFDGLADGIYYLEETKAPAGYNPLEKPKEIKVTGSDADDSKLTIKEGVANSTGTILPSTGGMGTTFFYVIGGIFVLASVVLLITRKRMEKVEK